MTDPETLKAIVREKYSQIAQQTKAQNAASCCGCGDPSDQVYNIMTDSYDGMAGYAETADLGLGCGLPTEFAHIRPGDTVIDLGSGAGNDCFIARHETGPEGKVIGIDFTPAMIRKARENAEKLGYNNVEFREGDIEDMPVSDNVADVVVSNCVLNLVPDKPAVMREIYRVLKAGGHFSISDIVLSGELPAALRQSAELYAGCVSGAIQEQEYLNTISDAGFTNISIQKRKRIVLPDDLLSAYLNEGEREKYLSGGSGIFSITVYATKPGQQPGSSKPRHALSDLGKPSTSGCCGGSGCCG
jgi:SAM-dependent methyltransferase